MAGAIPSWYRRWADGVAESGEARGERRFFIDSGAGATSVLNRDVLDKVLDRHRIEPVDPTALSAAQTVGLFRDAELVVGVHGTGVSQVLFSRDTHVVELMQGRTLIPRLYYLATSKGLAYDYVPAADPRSADGHHSRPGRPGVVVDVTWLDSLLGRIG
jgi:capsular polysaccharide biosynthesis protein